MNENIIARRAFGKLVLDYIRPADEFFPPCVKCRVLIDGWYRGTIYTETVEEAIEEFNARKW